MDEIPAEEITITLIRDRKPVKLLGELEKSGYECQKETAGIYYVYDVMFPVQIIASSELDTDMHVQLKALTNQLNETVMSCLLYTSPSPRDKRQSRMPSSA